MLAVPECFKYDNARK